MWGIVVFIVKYINQRLNITFSLVLRGISEVLGGMFPRGLREFVLEGSLDVNQPPAESKPVQAVTLLDSAQPVALSRLLLS